MDSFFKRQMDRTLTFSSLSLLWISLLKQDEQSQQEVQFVCGCGPTLHWRPKASTLSILCTQTVQPGFTDRCLPANMCLAWEVIMAYSLDSCSVPLQTRRQCHISSPGSLCEAKSENSKSSTNVKGTTSSICPLLVVLSDQLRPLQE